MVYVTGDTHGVLDIYRLKNTAAHLTEEDILIILGDFGLVWSPPSLWPTIEESDALNWLNNQKYTTLFLAGNHENYETLASLPDDWKFGGLVTHIKKKVFMLHTAETYIIQGIPFFVFGGAESIDKASRTEGVSWWRDEIPSYHTMSMGIEKYTITAHYQKDVCILTHTPPNEVIELLFPVAYSTCPVAKYLDLYLKKGYRHWYCGHMHIDYSIENLKLTIVQDKVLPVPLD